MEELVAPFRSISELPSPGGLPIWGTHSSWIFRGCTRCSKAGAPSMAHSSRSR